MALFGKGKVVLALGGGGSRGLAHLGVLQVLEEEGIPIHGIVGTSVGAIVGAGYSMRPDSKFLIRWTLEYLRSDRFQNDHFKRMMFGANEVEQNFLQALFTGIRRSLSFTGLIRRPSILSGDKLRQVIEEFVEDVGFEDTTIPFAVPALDLKTPIEVLLTEGRLRDAVVASCSIPGFFPPVELDDLLLCDVGVVGSIPVEAAQQFVPGAMVVAVDLSSTLGPIESVPRGWDSIMRVENFAAKKLNAYELEKADVVIRPEIGQKFWSDFSELQHMVDCGREAASNAVGDIHNRLKGWLPFVHGR